jgi:hypothetical protein
MFGSLTVYLFGRLMAAVPSARAEGACGLC